MFRSRDQQPPTARVVRGAGGPVASFVAHARPRLATAKRVGVGLVRAAFVMGCFVGVLAMFATNRSRSSRTYDFKLPKFDFQPPKFDLQSFQRSFDLSRELKTCRLMGNEASSGNSLSSWSCSRRDD
ncbi:MAG: hypothetical protein NT062_06310 [Proteobacteria bacterium]|nr:hypothetical protein [Pseudomonadota bacterium]